MGHDTVEFRQCNIVSSCPVREEVKILLLVFSTATGLRRQVKLPAWTRSEALGHGEAFAGKLTPIEATFTSFVILPFRAHLEFLCHIGREVVHLFISLANVIS